MAAKTTVEAFVSPLFIFFLIDLIASLVRPDRPEQLKASVLSVRPLETVKRRYRGINRTKTA